ncbi:MAG: LPP20 family lipoprotein [Pseudomonadota bacterium]
MKRFYLFAALFAFFAFGCASDQGTDHPIQGVNPDGTPKWVHRGNGVFEGPNGKSFFGVGIMQGVQNEALARQTADNRARAEIAKMFDLYIAAMMKDYQRSTTAGDFQASAEEQDVVSAQKTITEVTLRGVEIRDHWVNPQSNALYALAVLDLDGMMKSMESAKQLNARIRDYVRENARRAFEDLNKELQNRSERSQ